MRVSAAVGRRTAAHGKILSVTSRPRPLPGLCFRQGQQSTLLRNRSLPLTSLMRANCSTWNNLARSGTRCGCRVQNSKAGNVFEARLADVWVCQMERYRDYTRFAKCSKCELPAFCRGLSGRCPWGERRFDPRQIEEEALEPEMKAKLRLALLT